MKRKACDMVLLIAFTVGLVVAFGSGWLAASTLWRQRLRTALAVAQSYRELYYRVQGVTSPAARAQARMDTQIAAGDPDD